MPATAFTPSITSRPVYGVLEPRPGRAHLMVADGEGAEAILALFQKAGAQGLDLRSGTQIVYATAANGADRSADLAALGAHSFHHAPTLAAAMPRLRKTFADAHMGLQLYLAGTETLIGLVQSAAMEAGLPHDAMQTEHRGSLARRVQCVHCKGVTENVTTDPFRCAHCGLMLFVRDHYSRRLAAFQGVNIDAEDPGQVPPPEVKFP